MRFGLQFEVEIGLIQDSVEALADEIEFIASGKADDPKGAEVWDHRLRGGMCCYRLKRLLNFGKFADAKCELETIRHLKNLWFYISLLQYGASAEHPDDYQGALFLPHEHDGHGRFRTVDEEYISYEDLGLSVPGKFRDLLTSTKRSSWSYVPDELRLFSSLLTLRKKKKRGSMLVEEQPDSLVETSESSDEVLAFLKECPIPIEFRTEPTTKFDAAVRMGFRLAECKNLQRRLTAYLELKQRELKRVLYWPISRSRCIFDSRIFPQSD